MKFAGASSLVSYLARLYGILKNPTRKSALLCSSFRVKSRPQHHRWLFLQRSLVATGTKPEERQFLLSRLQMVIGIQFPQEQARMGAQSCAAKRTATGANEINRSLPGQVEREITQFAVQSKLTNDFSELFIRKLAR
jgi:hypothetical protein